MKNPTLLNIALAFVAFITIIIACKHEPLSPSITDPNAKTGGPSSGTGTNPGTNTGSGLDSTGWKCSPDTLYFQYDVLPILVSACGTKGCHDAITKEKGYVYADYATTISKGVTAGRATQSKLYTEIAAGAMPPRNAGIIMTQAQKDAIKKWIDQGAKNLTCNANYGACDTLNIKFSTYVATFTKDKCEGCHIGTNAGGGIKLTNYTEIKASVSTGKFLKSINHDAGISAMPKGVAKLPACDINKIKAWINRGALNN
jgi:hypothetical protein